MAKQSMVKYMSNRLSSDLMMPRIKQQLPANVDPEQFVGVAQMSLTNYDLKSKLEKGVIDEESVMLATLRCATDGLLLDGRQAAFTTFRIGKSQRYAVQYMPMVQGIIKIVLESGAVKSLYSKIVYEGEVFEVWNDENGQHMRHVERLDREGAKPIAVYAVAVLTNGGCQIEAMSPSEVMAVATASRVPDNYNPGKGKWWTEFWRKTAVRRLCKYLPLRNESRLDSVMAADNATFDYGSNQEVVQEPARAPQKTSRAKRLTEVAPEVVEEAEVVEPEVEPVESGSGDSSGATDEPPI